MYQVYDKKASITFVPTSPHEIRRIAEIQLKQITTTEESGAANAKRSVLYETLRVVPAQTARRQQRFTRFDISLSDWAGQEIEVTFRTRLSGSIAVRSRNWKGFAMVYRDPRVQADANGARP